MAIVNIAGARDLANALNRYRDQKDMEKHRDGIGFEVSGGRHVLMPRDIDVSDTTVA